MTEQMITPNDPRVMGETDSQSIQNAIRFAVQNSHIVRIPRVNERTGESIWSIEKTILLPSDITILLDGCHLRLADNVYENIFRNENAYEEIGKTSAGTQHDIYIIGRGNAILDGGNHNGVFEQTWKKLGLPHPRTGNLILFINVDGYRLENFKCINQRYWAINQLYCKHGFISGIHFHNGKKLHNQDGINFRIGCSHATVQNITGRTGDDVVALSCFAAGSETEFDAEDRDVDIHDITIRDVRAHTRQTIVALRCSDGGKIYRVHIENIVDAVGWTPEYGPWGCVRIGEVNYYRERPVQLGDIFDITVRGVYSLCRGTVFLGGGLKNAHISDIHAGGSSMHAISSFQRETVFWENGCKMEGGVTMENVVIENVYYDGTAGFCDDPNQTIVGQEWHGAALDFRCMRETDYFKNVIFRNIFAREGAEIAVCKMGVELDIHK